jgi:hypothetical protein
VGLITPFSRIPKASFDDVLVWRPPDEHIAKYGRFLSGFPHFPISGENSSVTYSENQRISCLPALVTRARVLS